MTVAMLQITWNLKRSSSKAKTYLPICKYEAPFRHSGSSRGSTLASINVILFEIWKARTPLLSSISRGYSARFLFVEQVNLLITIFLPNIFRQVNLLGKGEGEDKVSSAFAEVITKAQNQVNISIEADFDKRSVQGLQIEYTAIDYHKETPKGKNLRNVLMGHIGEALTNHHFLNFSNGSFISQQSGVVRTNCLDCLDRTNAVQTVIGRAALHVFFFIT